MLQGILPEALLELLALQFVGVDFLLFFLLLIEGILPGKPFFVFCLVLLVQDSRGIFFILRKLFLKLLLLWE